MSTGSKSNDGSIDTTVQPQTTVEPETTISPGAEPDIDNDIESEIRELDFEEEDDSEIDNWLSNIERDGLVSMEATRNTGLALIAGSAVYINEEAKGLSEALEDSLPEDFTIEEYAPEEAEELAAELEEYFDENFQLPDSSELPELPELDSSDSPIDLDYVDASEYENGLRDVVSEYSSEIDETIAENQPLIDEVTRKLNTNVTSWEEMGIDPSENIIQQLDPETITDAVLISFDNLAHLAITGTASNFVAQAADRYTDRESLIAAAGMSTALAYAVAKEGFYEGGAGLQFNPDNLDAQGDWMSDAIGAAWGTWSYLQNRAKEETMEGETDTGLHGSAAHKLGRAYEKSKYLAQTNLPTRMFQYETEDEFPTDLDIEDKDELAILQYEMEQTPENQTYAD